MTQNQAISRIDELGRKVLPTKDVTHWREANLQGSTPERLKTLQRWSMTDHRSDLEQITTALSQQVLPELCTATVSSIKAHLQEGGLVAASAYLKHEAEFWKGTIEQLPARTELLKQDRERVLKELQDRLTSIQGVLRLQKLVRSLPHLVSLRNRMSELEADQIRLQTMLNQIAIPLRQFILAQQDRLLSLNKALLDSTLEIKTEMATINNELQASNVFVEKIGGREDIVDYFAGIQLNIRSKLPRWYELVESEPLQIKRELLIDQVAVDDAIANHRLIDRRPNDVIKSIARAERIIAPYIDLASDPVNAPLHFAMLTGYTGNQNLTRDIAQGVNVTTSTSLSPNQVILAQVRIGLGIDDLAGIPDWRYAAQIKERENQFPLHTMDRTMMPQL